MRAFACRSVPVHPLFILACPPLVPLRTVAAELLCALMSDAAPGHCLSLLHLLKGKRCRPTVGAVVTLASPANGLHLDAKPPIEVTGLLAPATPVPVPIHQDQYHEDRTPDCAPNLCRLAARLGLHTTSPDTLRLFSSRKRAPVRLSSRTQEWGVKSKGTHVLLTTHTCPDLLTSTPGLCFHYLSGDGPKGSMHPPLPSSTAFRSPSGLPGRCAASQIG